MTHALLSTAEAVLAPAEAFIALDESERNSEDLQPLLHSLDALLDDWTMVERSLPWRLFEHGRTRVSKAIEELLSIRRYAAAREGQKLEEETSPWEFNEDGVRRLALDPNVIEELHGTPGMTDKRIAQLLAVDAKTVRRRCEEMGLPKKREWTDISDEEVKYVSIH